MKFFQLALVAAAASAELDESGLLQVHGSKTNVLTTKVKEFAQFTSRQVSNLPRDAKDLDPHTVDKFAMLLQLRLSQAEKQPNEVKAALLQRSMPSAGSPVAKVIDQIAALPIKTQETLAYQARDSQKLKETLATLPEIPEIHSLLLQVEESTNPFTENTTLQKPVQGVTVTYTDNMTCNDEAVTTKVRTTNTGWTSTVTHHNKCGTQTETLNAKNGYRHYHSYTHNGAGGNAKTVSESSFGCWDYQHTHSHEYVNGSTSTSSGTESTMCNKDGREKTYSHNHSHDFSVERGVNGKTTSSSSSSNSQTIDDDGDSWSHSHDHSTSHQHQSGVGTQSSTETNTETTFNGKRYHSHDHEFNHYHNEQDGSWSVDDDGVQDD